MAKKQYWLQLSVPQLPREVDRLFEEIIYRPWRGTGPKAEEWQPQVDLYETPIAFILAADLPGVKEQAVSVTVEEGELVLQGKRSLEQVRAEGDFYRHERRCGHFERRLQLPALVDQSRICVEWSDGVLRVTLPKVQPDKKLAR